MNSSKSAIDPRAADSIATNESDEIYATHPGTFGVSVYRKTTSARASEDTTATWTETNVSKAFFTKDHAQSTLAANRNYIAGSSDRVKRVFTRRVDCSAWKPFGPSKDTSGATEYEAIGVCAVDSKGNVLLVYKRAGVVRVMTHSGEFSSLTLAPACSKPRSACVMGRDLYLLQDEKTVTVAKYKFSS